MKSIVRAALCAVTLFCSAAHAATPLERGIAALECGEADVAVSAFEQARRAHPQDHAVVHWLARAEMRNGNAERAQSLLEDLIKQDPQNAAHHHWYAESLAAGIGSVGRLRQFRIATRMRDSWQRAVELDPGFIPARRSLMQFYLGAPAIVGGGKDKALVEAAEIRKRDPVAGHRAMAVVHLAERGYGAAAGEYEEAVAATPDDTELWMEYGYICQQAQDWDCAFAAFASVLELDAGHMTALYQVGRTAAVSGERLGEGADALTRYLRHEPVCNEPSLAWTNFRLGEVLERMERNDDARAKFVAAIALDPGHEQATAALARLDGN